MLFAVTCGVHSEGTDPGGSVGSWTRVAVGAKMAAVGGVSCGAAIPVDSGEGDAAGGAVQAETQAEASNIKDH